MVVGGVELDVRPRAFISTSEVLLRHIHDDTGRHEAKPDHVRLVLLMRSAYHVLILGVNRP